MLNYCPNCHLVSFGKNGWRYINKYNTVRMCKYCNHPIERFPLTRAPAWWLRLQEDAHSRWKETHTAKGDRNEHDRCFGKRNEVLVQLR